MGKFETHMKTFKIGGNEEKKESAYKCISVVTKSNRKYVQQQHCTIVS